MKQYYGDVHVVEKRRLRIAFEMPGKPTKESVLKLLRKGEGIHDIVDEEGLSFVEVTKIGVKDVTKEQEENEDF